MNTMRGSETAAVPEGKSISTTSQPESSSEGNSSQQKKQPASCSCRMAIGATVSVTTLVIVTGATLIILFYYRFVEEGATLFQGRELDLGGTGTKCHPAAYTGLVCKGALQSYHRSLLRNVSMSEQVHIPSVVDQEATENQTIQVLSNLAEVEPNITTECEELLTHFICIYMFGLCVDNDTLYLPSTGQCRTVLDMCVQELVNDVTTLVTSINCTDIEKQSPAGGGSKESDSSLTNQTVCQEDFYLGEDGLCRAECGKFQYWSHSVEDFFRVLLTISVVTGTTVAVVVLIVAAVKQKKLFTYPSVFIVYQLVTALVHNFSILVGRFDQATLFCSSIDLEESFRNPTAFCSFSGMVSMYVHIQIPLWLLFHAVSIFWGLKFPIHYRSYQASGKIRYIHATLFISGILVSLVNALVPFGAGGYGHSLAVPPVLCLPNKLSVYFYLQALPFLVVVMIALVLFLSIFWIVVKSYHKMSKHSMMVPEVKILVHLFILLLCATIIFTAADIFYYNFNEMKQTLVAYLDCESIGAIPGTICDKSLFEDTYRPFKIILNVAYIGFVLYPTISLIYVVDVHKVKKWLMACRSSKHISKSTPNTSV